MWYIVSLSALNAFIFMTKDELQKLLKDLEDEKRTITDQLNGIANKNPNSKEEEFTTRVPNYDEDEHNDDDYAHEVTDFERNQALEHELEGKLREIDKTIEKIKSGTYGKCENCSNVIQEGRLKAMPVAALCMQCAKRAK
jgi:RNA polymerase-binding transcription factor DksA